MAPAVFTVTNDTDKTPGDPRGDPGSFRNILDEAELAGGGTIDFAASVKTITFNGPLGFINMPMTIKGSGVTLVFPSKALTNNGQPIEAGLLFTNSGNILNGLRVIGSPERSNGLDFSDPFAPQGTTANNNMVVGVTVYGFGGAQLAFGGNNNTIQNDFLGTDSSGTAAKGGSIGLYLTGSGDTVGGATFEEGNVISGLTEYGVYLAGSNSTNNTLRRNRIGTDVTGKSDMGNGWSGVLIGSGANGNHFVQNVISANKIDGVDISGVGTTGNMIEGNFVGTDTTGNVALGNHRDGVELFGGASGNTIGGAMTSVGKPGGGNVISGNTEDGVSIFDNDANVTTTNQLIGNVIGTDITGARALPNHRHGVGVFDGAASNIIGVSGNGNVISANRADGIFIGPDSTSQGPSQTKIQSNYIGTNPAMALTLGNGNYGIFINGSQTVIGAPVGSSDQSLGNWIAYSGQQDKMKGTGVVVSAGHFDTIRLNHIFKNERLGIDLNNDYFDRFNPNPVTGGANNGQWHPTIIGVNGGAITWMLNASPSTHYTVDVYSDSTNNYLNYAEGQTPMGSPIDVTTDATGHAEFTTNVGSSKITATATDDNGNTSEFSLADEAGDGLCDTWKANGYIDLNGNGTHDAELPGADVHQKDLYVEYDSMAGWGPVAGALGSVQAVFANHSINLHLDRGPQAIAPMAFGSVGPPNNPIPPHDPWSDIQAVKQANFANHSGPKSPQYIAKLLAYRYCVFGVTYEEPASGPNPARPPGSSGLSEILGNDFTVTIGGPGLLAGQPASVVDKKSHGWVQELQAGTFMHEFGHALGLTHVGTSNWDGSTPRTGSPAVVEHDAAYTSVMNYRYQGGGIGFYANPGPPASGWTSDPQILNYSESAPDEWHNLWFAFQENKNTTQGGGTGNVPDESDQRPTLDPSADDLYPLAFPAPQTIGVNVAAPITFTIANLGPATAAGSTFTATIPAGLSIGTVTVTVSQGTVAIDGNTVTATFGDIPSLHSATLTVPVTAAQVGSFTLSGQAASTTTDGLPENNTTSVTVNSEFDNQIVPLPNGHLGVFGTNRADNIVLAPTRDGTKLQVTINKKVISKTIPLAGISQIDLSGKAGDDKITITNLAVPVQIDGGTGADLITVNPVLLTNQPSPVSLTAGDGFDRLVVNGSKAINNVFVLNSNSLTINGGLVSFGSLAGLSLVGQRHDDAVTIASDPAFPVRFNGGAGSDSLTVASVLAAPVTFNGGGGSDTLVGFDVANNWLITGSNAGTLTGLNSSPLTFSGVENLTGGSDTDSFTFLNGKKVSGVIDAKAGDASLDFSDWTGPVVVDLSAVPLVKCSGAGGGIRGSFSTVIGGSGNDRLTAGNIDTILIGNGGNDILTGGPGNDILIGGSGNDALIDTSGTNIMIGGDGADQLIGGGGNDLMVAGQTSFETDLAGLSAIKAEWVSGDSYSTKVAILNANFLNADTVQDDFVKDTLTGLMKGGDWFIVSARDTNDAGPGETVTTI